MTIDSSRNSLREFQLTCTLMALTTSAMLPNLLNVLLKLLPVDALVLPTVMIETLTGVLFLTINLLASRLQVVKVSAKPGPLLKRMLPKLLIIRMINSLIVCGKRDSRLNKESGVTMVKNNMLFRTNIPVCT